MSRICLLFLLAVAGLGAAGCPSVDCEALCQRTLACEITFAPSDDPDEQKVDSGERTELASCALGCEESPTVTVESAACVDGVEVTGNPAACQLPIAECLGIAEALAAPGGAG